MSAIPIPRGRSAAGAAPRYPCVSPDGGPPDFYGQVPARPIASDLSDRAKVVLVALTILGRGSQTWVSASLEEVALTAGHSVKKVRLGLAELTERGVIEWDSVGRRFRVLFRLRGSGESGPSSPAPRLSPDPEPEREPKRVPIWEPKRAQEASPHTPVLFEREKEIDNPACAGTTTTFDPTISARKGDDVDEPRYNPRLDPEEPDDQPGEDELHEAIAQRVIDLFGAANRAWIRADIREYGEIALEHALDKCERLPSPPRHYGYVRAMLRNARDEGTEIGRPRPRSERHAPPQQNYNPGKPAPAPPPSAAELAEMIAKARGSDAVTRKLFRAALRGMVASGLVDRADVPSDLLGTTEAEKKPAPGSLGKVPPEPAPEMYGNSVPIESYPPVQGSARPKSELPPPHCAGRDGTPRVTLNPAQDPAKQGILPVPQIYTGVTCRECSQQPKERAREDSHLQPSDSKSPGLVTLAGGPRAPTAPPPAIPPSGAPPARPRRGMTPGPARHGDASV